MIYITLVINPDGAVSDIMLPGGVHKLLDEEALRMIRAMPALIPVKTNGKPVRENLPNL